MDNIKSFKNEVEIRLIKTHEEWNQFVDLTNEIYLSFMGLVDIKDLNYHQQNDRYLYGYFINDKLIGSIGIQIEKRKKLGLIGYLQVKNEFRKQGFAKKLFNRGVKILKENYCNFIYLWVLEENKETINMYIRWGFKRVPMIYNLILNKHKNSYKKQINNISEKIIVKKKRQLDNLITEIYKEYYLFNKVFQPIERIYEYYLKKCVYLRQIEGRNHLIFIRNEKKDQIVEQILLLKKRGKEFSALEEELREILAKIDSKAIDISIFGNLVQKEIDNIQNMGFSLLFPYETRAYLLELD